MTDPSLCWPNVVEYIGDQGPAAYSAVATAAILTAFEAGEKEFALVAAGSIYTISFATMQQTRKDNKKFRSIVVRCDPATPLTAVSRFAPMKSPAFPSITSGAVWNWTKFGPDATGCWQPLAAAEVAAMVPSFLNNGGIAICGNRTFDANSLLCRNNCAVGSIIHQTEGLVSPLRLDVPDPSAVLYFDEEKGWMPYDAGATSVLLDAWTKRVQQDFQISLGPAQFTVNTMQGFQRSNRTFYTRPIAFVRGPF